MTMLRSITEVDLAGKRVLIREDFNVPIVQGYIVNDRRIQAALPTIEYALAQGAAIILVSHLGRPTAGCFSDEFSLAPIAVYLSRCLNQPVRLVKNWVTGITISPGEIVLCENVRFQAGEQSNALDFAQQIAQLAEVLVMDAFAVAHRTAASTVGMMQYAKEACAGLLLLSELENLMPLESPERPFIALVGGDKISTKLNALESLIARVDHLLLGGRLANTFLAAQSIPLHESLYNLNYVEAAHSLLKSAESSHCTIHLPQDVVVTSLHTSIHSKEAKSGRCQAVSAVQLNEKIGDIGPVTVAHYSRIIESAGTIFWNGPMGLFEQEAFQEGTKAIAQSIAQSSAFSIAGGGETLSAIDCYQYYPTCISTGGGALLAWVSGQPLPAVQALQALLSN
jgi:phosphoglycerate kinase